MNLYGNFSKEEWLKTLNINETNIPSAFIIHGEWEHEENLKNWRTILSETKSPKWNTLIGLYKGSTIGYANAYGSPAAINSTHPFAAVGTDLFVQTGYFGGLSLEVNYGDLLIVTEAEMQDGVSNWYFPDAKTIKSDERIINAAIDYCEKKKYPYIAGSIVTTNTLLHETNEQIAASVMKGHLGIDMETASTLAAAKRFNRKAIGLLNLSEHILKGDTLYAYTSERETIEAETDEKIRDVALYLAANTNKFTN
ncbi:uridine phosphorylase [Peribacillus psychrosaccharolyticus]|uniref:Uridine phosphorylase n=1 Tax=Peribacillus psychrosaccharolyticus TaxID=1407 RepID=A0A974S1A1_PERPY|nr:uridine phosphorylase [Peribacillus psychrosaccharolyticus]MEC2053989.1 uridine phosphorylase [Peribacillus psychrosaccharolyticus]MED3742396.1 uridine phosphorylase [Peribacillus psychrosaccharolyticus]QQT01359.1 uridine phosphorylase [Peribacillus psychrosaccharolyticus]